MIVPALRKFLTSGSDKKPVLVVLAGPNGAGKTTFHELFIAPSGLPFVNADIIAKELAEKGKPVADYEAAQLAEQKRQEYVSEKRSFCMETVFHVSSFAEPYRPVAMYVAGEPRQLFPPLPPWAHFILPKPLIRKK